MPGKALVMDEPSMSALRAVSGRVGSSRSKSKGGSSGRWVSVAPVPNSPRTAVRSNAPGYHAFQPLYPPESKAKCTPMLARVTRVTRSWPTAQDSG
eukprot:1148048-Pelagomonas_calceolata.AAC.17